MTTNTDDRTSRLPTGVLTFLFTDVVDSTLLWESAPTVMDTTLARHDAIIDRAVESHGGLVLKHKGEGDSTFCVFESAPSAAAAAVDAQRAIRTERWDGRTPIRVRMGIHTGESILRGRDYYGQTINRAARVRAVADGGQVLLSGAASFAIGDALPGHVDMRYIRRQKLKGIERAEEIYELVDEELPALDDSVGVDQSDGGMPLPDAITSALPAALGGRGEKLSLISDFVDQPGSGGRLLVLRGEPGAGKSTIAAVAAASAHDAGAIVLHGSCGEKLDTPFEPFRTVFGAYVDRAPRDVLAGHIAEHGGEISRLAPRLRLRVGTLPPDESLDTETARLLLIEAAVDLLQRAVEERPVMVVIDDLHWADQNTLLLIEHLLRVEGPLTIIATSRPESDPSAVSLARLIAYPNVVETELRGFDGSEIVGLLSELADGAEIEGADEVAAYFLEETNGNPFFVVELFRHLSESGRVVTSGEAVRFELDDAAPPQSVRAVIQERLARLAPDTGRLLSLASVAGREFDPVLLATVLDVDEDDVLDSIEEATRVALVREVGLDRFAFEHALVQHALADQLGPSRTARHHRRLAAALVELHGDDANPSQVADHWLRGGPAGRGRLGPWARRAGAAAMDDLAPAEAIVWFGHALDVADGDQERLEVLLELGAAQRWVDDDACRATLLDAARLAQQAGDRHALVRAALTNNRGGASAAGRVDPERVEVLERALDGVADEDSEDRARLLATLAIENSQGSGWEVAERYARAAKECALRLGDDTTLLRVLLLTSEATRVPMTLDERLDDMAALLDLARRGADPVLLGIAALRDVRVKLEAAQFDQVEPSMRLLEQNARLDPYLSWNYLCVRAVHEHALGQIDRALATAQEAYDTSESQPDRGAVFVASTSMMRWDQGTLSEMLPLIEGIAERYPGITGFRANLALAQCSAGRDDAARELLRHEVETEFADHPMNPLWLMTLAEFASVAIELEHPEAAALLDDRLRPWRGRANTSVVSVNGLVTETLAGLSVLTGDFETAEADAEDALEQATRLGARPSATRTHLTLARLFHRRGREGDRERAIAEARLAAAQAAELGMQRVHEQATALEKEPT